MLVTHGEAHLLLIQRGFETVNENSNDVQSDPKVAPPPKTMALPNFSASPLAHSACWEGGT